MNKSNLSLFFLFTGVLSGICWPHTGGLTFLSFIAFVPFLLGESYVYTRRLRPWRVFLFSYLMFLVFNFITTWWIMNASMGGMLMAVFVNALLMALFVLLFHLVHRRYGSYWGYTSFVCIWMSFEYCHYHWELSWPWLNLGNVFATHPNWVQWYEYTGVAGGTLWVLLVNICIFHIVNCLWIHKVPLKKRLLPMFGVLTLIGLPLLFSYTIAAGYEEKSDPIDVVVVQPNIDPYGDKFGGMTGEEQMVIILREAFMSGDSTVDFVVGPETALPYSINENGIESSGEVELMRRAFARWNKTAVVIGMSSHKTFAKGEKMPDNARVYPDGQGVEFYNAALFLKPQQGYEVYHKSQLVLGVEKIPFAKWLPFLEKLALDMGGTTGTLGIQEKPTVFKVKDSRARVAPSICYESIYGEHMAGFVNAGANVIFVVTNDGWWGETPGFKQHLDYGRLTAISLRRSIAQSANTGLSGFINQKGEVVAVTEWWKQCALRHKINLNNEITVYAAYGDVIYRMATCLAIAFFVLYVYAFLTGKNYTSNREV